MLSALTDLELVEEINRGNMAAFRAFYYRHVDAIFGLVTRIMGPSSNDREDVVQEVFYQAHGAMKRFLGLSSVSTWLNRIAVNITYSHLRRASSSEVQMTSDVESVRGVSFDERRLDARRAISLMYALLDQISPENRIVFALYEFQGFTLDEISSLLDIPLHTAASRLRRSRERLMRALLPVALDNEGEKT